MPELPEVETLRRALLPLIPGKRLAALKFYRPDLRFPIPTEPLTKNLPGAVLGDITRIGKYLLLHFSGGAMLWHLGMSGRVEQGPSLTPIHKHDHAVFHFEPDIYLHFVDPRRFGCILWVPDGKGHPLIDHLGPDPLAPGTTAKALKARARTCKGPIKGFLMNATRLAGIGNIYACESLHAAGIHPNRSANKLTLPQWETLLATLRVTLEKSIASGGTTLRDFFSADGSPGYYTLDLAVYGRESKPCKQCGTPIVRKVHSGRSTFFCKVCQKR
ncbi:MULTISPECIES: bifunctional DNA-formamidopyrimidine glycosylase/DNA-(apurinic or apyrimidinic site) lyase [unclassified Nitrospina]|uniref:bifunctional DNA-formamidopyrimidine glycosylase/DNA-(apurinic or apyrimidinic site) lyase n=1 Tax=unclassified Nitrospina TaxID=2638683 RepID=UPI003F990C90